MIFRALCESSAVRAVALLGPHAKQHHVRPFEMPGVNLFSGNELDPTDQPDAALIFGGDGTVHRHLGGLALKQIPTLIVPVGSANDFAQSIGIASVEQALAAWRRFCTVGRQHAGTSTWEQFSRWTRTQPRIAPKPSYPGRDESLETLHFVPDGPRPDQPKLAARIMRIAAAPPDRRRARYRAPRHSSVALREPGLMPQ